jgi:hypothetical protein
MNGETPEERVQRVVRNKGVLDRVKLMQAMLALEASRRQPEPESEPLVSVRICTFNRPDLLVERAIASVSRQSYSHWEIVVVGDGAGPETEATLRKLNHPKVRYRNLPARPRYPRFPRFFWFTAGIYAVNAALDDCRGSWIAPLDDDDEFTPDHMEVLLKEARVRNLEMVYGQMDVHTPQGWQPLGIEPLTKSKICHGSVMYSARLQMLRYDPFTWLDQEPGDRSGRTSTSFREAAHRRGDVGRYRVDGRQPISADGMTPCDSPSPSSNRRATFTAKPFARWLSRCTGACTLWGTTRY